MTTSIEKNKKETSIESSIDYEKIISVARQAANEAGRYLRQFYGDRPEVEFKGDVNLITEKDRESQKIICNIIKNNFPDHSILAEEDLEVRHSKSLRWIVDPIDGTTNFAHSLPIFSISIALQVNGETHAGVVYIPVLDEMFHAVRGAGAFLNDRKIHVSNESRLIRCLIATGFPYDRAESEINNVKHFNNFILKTRDIRRMGSAAVDLAYTAAGRFDGYWELKLQPWDCSAGYLLVLEAGGRVTDFSGNPFDPFKPECLATNSHIHQTMLDILNMRD
jgi:myo-inositol-1(or 4)-monophosphatase